MEMICWRRDGVLLYHVALKLSNIDIATVEDFISWGIKSHDLFTEGQW
jgi:hypothetical protein